MITLGLNGFAGADHDAAAALVIDGRVVAAVEEERLNRRRHAPGDEPALAVPEVLRIAGVKTGDIDAVCHGWRPQALGLGLTERHTGEAIRDALASVDVAIPKATPVTFVDHHLAHFWSGVPFIAPGLARDEVDGLVIDGAGESTSGAYFRLRHGSVEKVWNLGLAGSLGLLYEAATSAIGFRRGDEGKTMGLASYGREQAMDRLPALPDDRFAGLIPVLGDRDEIRRQHRAGVLRMRALVPAGASFNRRADLALGVQSQVEAQIMGYLGEQTEVPAAFVLAGGVALNCSINATVARWCAGRGAALTIPPPANDGGIAIGAAVAASADPASCVAESAFLGRGFTPEEIRSRLAALGATPLDHSPGELADRLVDRDQICGWFEGRAEIGPRALGKRAVLARADSTRTRDRLNVLKGRESWRPLAPSVLPEEFEASFLGTPSPHMLINCAVATSALRPLAGVVHVDNTARPQVLGADLAEGPYVALLRELRQRTGHAVVTCTSFNPAGQPIVYSPEDAYRAAVAMGLDLLAGDGWCVSVPRP
ncbi:carbamoyltransferase C-terminal domain-containing protein [Solihabitans fulvus]|uniref:carbamoyltransferase C-terminal domain-containing protein n=1 Tax=Solihabitans fulvus TaxID=1892852 RepID=UPI001661CE47|nr:carbamoyltransferase C-terminal domain-containing protein [Solihabitans fulvus]